jgi:hypothetical protein
MNVAPLFADDAARLVSSLRGMIKSLSCVRIRCEWLALDDANGREHAEPGQARQGGRPPY